MTAPSTWLVREAQRRLALVALALIPWHFIYAPTIQDMKAGQSGYLPAGALVVDHQRHGWVIGYAHPAPDLMTNSQLYVTQTKRGLDVEVKTCEHIVWPLSAKPAHAVPVATIHQARCGTNTGHW